MPVTKISVGEARELHNNYMLNPGSFGAPLTRGVLFDIGELNEAIAATFGPDHVHALLDGANRGFVMYYGRYASTAPGGLANRNTLILQFVEKIGSDWYAVANEIYNYGDIIPPKIIFNEQVTP